MNAPEKDQTPRFAVFDDDDTLVAVFVDETVAWAYANQCNTQYVQDGCYYVEELDVQ